MSDNKFDDKEDEENYNLKDIVPEPFVDAASDDEEVSEDAQCKEATGMGQRPNQ